MENLYLNLFINKKSRLNNKRKLFILNNKQKRTNKFIKFEKRTNQKIFYGGDF